MTELRQVGIVLGAAAAIGWVTGTVLQSVLVAAVALLAWQTVMLLRFRRWLDRDDRTTLRMPAGAWRDSVGEIERLRARARRARKRLSRFSRRFEEAAEATPDALVLLNRNAEILWCNQSALPLLGLAWPKHARQSLQEAIAKPTLADYVQSANFAVPLELACPVNRAIVLSIRVAPFGRKKHQLLLVASDITRVHNLDLARRDFIANVSHELRSPLTVISGFLDPLAETLRPDMEWTRPIELMQEQVRRMASIISDLSVLSRLETEAEIDGGEAAPVPGMLAAIIEEAEALSAENDHEIVRDLDAGLWLTGRREELHSAFSNLVFNAIRHTPPRTRIEIRWARDEATTGARFTVRDFGPGIPPRHIPRLTERFYRVDMSRSRQSGGTGLGLAIVNHVLKRHGARLEIDSEPGRGSTFSCIFPDDRIIERPDKNQPLAG